MTRLMAMASDRASSCSSSRKDRLRRHGCQRTIFGAACNSRAQGARVGRLPGSRLQGASKREHAGRA